jgi:hypothetical protein
LLLYLCPQHLEEDASDGGINEIAQQLAFSDLILLNKTDLVDSKQMERVKQAVRRINQSATLHECQLNQEGGRPPLSLLLDNNGFSVNKALKVDPEFLHSDSGSDLEESDTDSDVDSDGEGAAEGGVPAPVTAADGGVDDIPSQPQAVATAAAKLAGRAATDAEGSCAQQGQSKQEQQAEADSSQLTSTTAVTSSGRKRSAAQAHADGHTAGCTGGHGDDPCKVGCASLLHGPEADVLCRCSADAQQHMRTVINACSSCFTARILPALHLLPPQTSMPAAVASCPFTPCSIVPS